MILIWYNGGVVNQEPKLGGTCLGRRMLERVCNRKKVLVCFDKRISFPARKDNGITNRKREPIFLCLAITEEKSMTRKTVRFTTSKGRGSFELHKDTSATLYEKAKRLAKLCGESERKGVVIDDADKVAIKKLPTSILNQFIEYGLWDGVSTKKIPTLSSFLDIAIPVTGTKRTQKKREQYRGYLLEYHGDKQIHLIDAIEAHGFVPYYTTEGRRNPKYGKSLGQCTVGRAVRAIRGYFDKAVKFGYIKANPYIDVSAKGEPDKKRRKWITRETVQSIADCIDDITFKDAEHKAELKCLIGFHRHCGVRGESEWQTLRFSDFQFLTDGTGSVRVPLEGKTDDRIIPVFDDFLSYFVALTAAVFPGQDFDAVAAAGFPGKEFVFERLRTYSNVRSPIRRAIKKAGLNPKDYPAFSTNCRRSFIKDKIEEGFNDQQLTQMVGNTADIRKAYYALGITRDEVAGWSRRSSDGALVPVPQKFVPESAPLPAFDKHFYELFHDGTSDVGIIYQMLVMVGWDEKRAREIAENDRSTMTVAKDLRHCYQRTSDYMAGRISRLECIVYQLGFIVRSYWGLLVRNPIYLALADRKFALKRAEMLLVARGGLEPPTYGL